MLPRYMVFVFMVLWFQATFLKGTYGQNGCQNLDLAIVIDASGSICDTDPNFDYNRDTTCQNWSFLLEFVVTIINGLTIGLDFTRVAVVTFATQTQLRWNLTAYTDKASLINAIRTQLPYLKGGRTDTTGALNSLVNQVFNNPGDRMNVNNTAIIITDGRPTVPETVQSAVDAVHNAGIRTLVVGVTNSVDNSTLKQLSSPPQMPNVTYFWATDFNSFSSIIVQLTNQACSNTQPTVAPPPSPTTRQQTAPPNPSGCDVIDLCFLVDRSGSICDSDANFVYQRDNTCSNWGYIVKFIGDLVNFLNIGPNNVRVALIIFSSNSQVAWNLNNYTDKASLMSAINSLPYIKGGTTDTAGALDLASNRVFNTATDRPEASNVIICITDGKPTDPGPVPARAQALQNNNVKMFAVGITNQIDENTLKTLSSAPHASGINYFLATDYRTIDSVRLNLQSQTCNVASTSPANQVACNNVQELAIALDGSGSICDSDPNFNFQRDYTCNNWNSTIQFVHNIINDLTIGPTATRVALVIFDSTARLMWGLDAYTDKTSLLYAIDNLQYRKGGTTDTTGALNVIKDQVFTPQVVRPNVAKTVICITDGKPTNPSTVQAAIDAVQANNIRTLVVGITNQVDTQTLVQLASPPKTLGVTYFMASDFQSVNQIRVQLVSQTCPGSSTQAPSTSSSTMAPPTSPSTSTAPTTPTLPSTSGTTRTICTSMLDLCFLVDGSGSICDSDPNFVYDRDSTCNNWSFILQFISRIVQGLSIGINQIRVGMVTFASEAVLLWNLTAYTTNDRLLTAINSIQYRKGGRTFTTEGLNMMRTQIFGTADDRPTVNNTAIIITDGKPTNPDTVQAAIDAVHNAGIKTLVVGVTDQVDTATLRQLSSPPQQQNVTYFTATNFDSLETVRNIIETKTCDTTG